MTMSISIIIPTLNEEKQIGDLIQYLRNDPSFSNVSEILVVDGNSEDRTRSVARYHGVRVLVSPIRNRGKQMNLGATYARGSILYFLHADTYPPSGFANKINDAVANGSRCGCFRLRFNWSHWFLKANSWFTRFNFRAFRFGDQSLFVERQLFSSINGYRENMKLFEDQDIVSRLKQACSFEVLPGYVVTSARKYRKNGPYRLQLVYFLLFVMFTLGFSQKSLEQTYRNFIPYPML
jgi:rSAM/selenodomain-associated transferase 2